MGHEHIDVDGELEDICMQCTRDNDKETKCKRKRSWDVRWKGHIDSCTEGGGEDEGEGEQVVNKERE